MAPASVSEFETALRSQIYSHFLGHFPASFLNMKVGDFLQLQTSKEKNGLSASVTSYMETPKTATRRSTRTNNNTVTSSNLSTITKSVKKRLFPLSTPSKSSVPTTQLTQTPHLTIKSSLRPGASVSKLQAISHTPSSRRSKTSHVSDLSISRPSQSGLPPQTPSGSGGIVQFQLDGGKIVDVDFSRSPESALHEANLLGSDAIGEVKSKIETYANQFMQYLKFFKKFKPTK